MCLMYLTTARVGELCRGKVSIIDEEEILPNGKHKTLEHHIESLPSIKKNQFVMLNDNFIHIRSLRIIKRHVKSVNDYSVRNEIKLPLKGELFLFVEPIVNYLKTLNDDEELFKFGTKRGFQIVNHITGYMPHYLREMGLKFWLRAYDKNISTLKDFSGHERYENLLRYLTELQTDKNLLEIKLE